MSRPVQAIMTYVGAALALYIALMAVMYFGQRKLMYYPDPTIGTPASHGIAEAVPIRLQSSGNLSITSWFRAPGTNKPIIVYFHGNAGHVGDRGFKARAYVEEGYGVLLVGYRGYGGNPGSPSEQGLYDDASTALDFLTRIGVRQDHWVLYGESLGAAVAVEMAVKYNNSSSTAAIVLEAPFTSMADAAKTHYPYVPVSLLLRDKYDSMAKIKNINSPLFILHGDGDQTVPQHLGRQLFEAALEPKFAKWIEGAGHGDLYDFGAARHVMEFVEDVWVKKPS